MAVYKIPAKKDSWTSGEDQTIYIPVVTDISGYELDVSVSVSSTSKDDLISFINEHSDFFDPAISIPSYSTESTSFLNSLNFFNLIDYTSEYSNKTHYFYVNETQYLSTRCSLIESAISETWGTSQFTSGVQATEYAGTSNVLWFPYVPQFKGTNFYFTVQIGSNLNRQNKRVYFAYITKREATGQGGQINKLYFETLPEYDEDPYSQGGNSGEGGGTGTFSGTGDSIEFPNLPTLSAVSTGFITLFNPSISQMQSLATYMWSDVFDIGLYKTLFADPMDCILGCSIVPVAVPNGGTKTVNVGNVSTGISMTVAASQYVEVDCGTLNVEEYWGSYLDYDPYTKAEIYLPYCGTHALQVDDIMGKAVHVKYHVDILSGACCAYVKCGSSVMYSFVGQCSSSIPISANDWTNVVNGALTIAASVGSLIATGGASAPMAVGAAAAVTGTIYGGGIKQNVEKSGSMGGTGGMLAVQTPYLILTRPRQALPKKQNTYTGYPSFITTKLEDLKGYTEIDSIRITGVPATDAELNELESILKSGVIF